MRTLTIATIAALLGSPALAGLDVPPIYVTNPTAASSSTPTAQSSWTVAGQKWFVGFTVVPSVAGYAMAWDATSAPADGAVSPAGCWPVSPPAAGGPNPYVSMANSPAGVLVSTGITVAFSTTGCFVKTASAAFISINYQNAP